MIERLRVSALRAFLRFRFKWSHVSPTVSSSFASVSNLGRTLQGIDNEFIKGLEAVERGQNRRAGRKLGRQKLYLRGLTVRSSNEEDLSLICPSISTRVWTNIVAQTVYFTDSSDWSRRFRVLVDDLSGAICCESKAAISRPRNPDQSLRVS
jgi:hypothetical protein